MPRLTKFKDGDIVISVVARGDIYNHQPHKGDICKIIFEADSSSYIAEVIQPGPKSQWIVGHYLEYRDDGFRKLERVDLIELYRKQAKEALEKANRLFKKADIWQKYPTVQDELTALVDRIMTAEPKDFAEIEAQLTDLSFDITPENPPDVDQFNDAAHDWK